MKIFPGRRHVSSRLLNPDGSYNVVQIGRRSSWDLYHRLLSAPWSIFLLGTVLVYVALNLLFGLAFYSLGPGALEGATKEGVGRLWDCIFFSVQTLATIGYGRMTPRGLGPNLLVALEALLGLLGLALVTGLLFSRFSRPTAKVLFSRLAVVQKRNGVPCLVFRIANERLNQIVNADISVSLRRQEETDEGEVIRAFHDLKLRRSHAPFFALSWTVIHEINESSPLWGVDLETARRQDLEIFVSLLGIDDTFSQTVHARHSYTPEEIRWGQRFRDMVFREPTGLRIDLNRIHEVESDVTPSV